LVSILRLSGLSRVVEGYLCVRNRIYYRVFDQAWVMANMPDAELRRQRAAYRRGWLRAAALMASAAAIFAFLAFTATRNARQAVQARIEAEQAKAEAERQRKNAEDRRLEAEQQRIRAEHEAHRAEASAQQAQKDRADAIRQKKIAEDRRLETEQQQQRIEALEQNTWDMIKDQTNPDLLKGYLDTYPNGKYAVQARRRLSAPTATSGALEGVVYDVANNLPIVGARVTVTNQETGLVRSAVTGKDGLFLMGYLPAGPYTITAEFQGYDSSTVTLPVRLARTTVAQAPFGGLRKIR
jgi:hypothetical protein